ncbi:MAG TPA: calcium-binding protein, partial [Candidatus Omnitrophota bacterium]|nr:calcium-binding protein [Candidatus Omnitrophota bacterium]
MDRIGTIGDDVLVSSDDSEKLEGGLGDDVLLGEGGDDSLDAGKGADILDGGAGSDKLLGGEGNDLLIGGAGLDTLDGGLGDDVYVLDVGDIGANGVPLDIIVDVGGSDTVETAASVNLSANTSIETIVLTGADDVSATGNALNNTVQGNDGDNTLNGGTGTDTLIGGVGDDTYVVDTQLDQVVEYDGEGNDTVQTTLTTLSLSGYSNIENLAYSGTAAATLTGNSGANVITGAAGADLLDGGAGADTLVGGAGDDTYV